MSSDTSSNFYAERDRRLAQVAESLGRLTSASNALNRHIEGGSDSVFLPSHEATSKRETHELGLVAALSSLCGHRTKLWQRVRVVVSL